MPQPLDYATPPETPPPEPDWIGWLKALVLALIIVIVGSLIVFGILLLFIVWLGAG